MIDDNDQCLASTFLSIKVTAEEHICRIHNQYFIKGIIVINQSEPSITVDINQFLGTLNLTDGGNFYLLQISRVVTCRGP
jgi:hypothetical protein